MKRKLVIAALLLIVLVAIGSFRSYRGRTSMTAIPSQKPSHVWSVQERVAQYGAAVEPRLRPAFDAARIPYPPAAVALLGFKQEKRLEVFASGRDGAFRLVRSYPILGASGVLGPKQREGDLQVPEGLYRIELLNPNSLYHLSLRVNYPNEFDRARATEESRTDLGGDIMIHGGRRSIGCLAMGDEAVEDLFVLCALTGLERVEVILSPVDFRMGTVPKLPSGTPEWARGLYASIQEGLARFPVAQ